MEGTSIRICCWTSCSETWREAGNVSTRHMVDGINRLNHRIFSSAAGARSSTSKTRGLSGSSDLPRSNTDEGRSHLAWKSSLRIRVEDVNPCNATFTTVSTTIRKESGRLCSVSTDLSTPRT